MKYAALSRCFLVGCSLLVLSGTVRGERAADTPPWSTVPLQGNPAAILQAANAKPVPQDAEVEVLLEDTLIRFEADGRQTRRVWRIYRCLTEQSLENWSYCQAEWAPWREQRPQIRARVISPRGEVHLLAPENLAEVPVEQGSPSVYSDNRYLRGPLPAVEVGAVIEEEIVVTETRPPFKAGVVGSITVGRLWPVRTFRVTLDAPVELPLRHELRQCTTQALRSEADGRVRIELELHPSKPMELPKTYLSTDKPFWPQLVFSTGQSWSTVAVAYADIVEQQIENKRSKQVLGALFGETPARQLAASKDKRAVAERLLARLRQSVRYTGVEFGESAIVPSPPWETLVRRYGDCKDQSALLVALLRECNVTAYVALVRVGSRSDVSPDLPGLGCLNHAIVHVPGDEPLWIDPTARGVPAGEIPLELQSHWALVATADTQHLVQIPRAESTANLDRDEFELRVEEDGMGTVQRVTLMRGSCASHGRDLYAAHTKKWIREVWQEEAQNNYATRDLTRLEYPSPSDFSAPFRIEIEIANAALANASDSSIRVPVYLDVLFDRLPTLLTHPAAETQEAQDDVPTTRDTGGSAGHVASTSPESDSGREQTPDGEHVSTRKDPLQLPEPHVRELQYRVVPPLGFAATDRSADSWSKRIGCIELAVRIEKQEGSNEVLVCARLDTGSGQLSPEQVDRFRETIAKLNEDDAERWNVTIEFEHAAAKLLAEGRIKEGLTELHRLLEQQPTSSHLQMRWARALLQAGLGDAARVAAQRAVQLQPDSAVLHARLADVLTNDLLGRRFRRGMDWQGAAEAYRTALKLDPTNPTTRANYAILLEHNEHGQRYAAERLDESIKQYRRAIDEQLKPIVPTINLALVLLQAERFGELKELVEERPNSSSELQAYLLAATAAEDGAEAAVRKSRRIERRPASRSELLVTAGDLLQGIRRYGISAQLLEAAADASPGEAHLRFTAATYRRVKRRLDAERPADDPCRVVEELFCRIMRGTGDVSEFRDLFRRDACDADIEAELSNLTHQLCRLREMMHDADRSPRRIADAVAAMDFRGEGDDAVGHRVIPLKGVMLESPEKVVFFVIREAGEYRILEMGPSYANLGNVALAELDAGNVKAATHWLTRAYKFHRGQVAWFGAFSGSPFGRQWWMSNHEDATKVRLAAALLACDGRQSASGLPVLLEARENSELEHEQCQIDRALARAYRRSGNYRELLQLVTRMSADHPNVLEPILLRCKALHGLGRDDAVREYFQELLGQSDLDPEHRRRLAVLAADVGEFTLAKEHLDKLAGKGRSQGRVMNELAWISLCLDSTTAEALEAARKAVQRTAYRDDACLHTLATVAAELGRTDEALEQLRRAVVLRGDRVAREDWYVLGRIAQQYALPDVAASMYRKVNPPEVPTADDTYVLAQRQLEALANAATLSPLQTASGGTHGNGPLSLVP
jgi:tetratricopeptide (TPR) repeat protein